METGIIWCRASCQSQLDRKVLNLSVRCRRWGGALVRTSEHGQRQGSGSGCCCCGSGWDAMTDSGHPTHRAVPKADRRDSVLQHTRGRHVVCRREDG
eukprot:947694-Prymnesium_polylepis.1